MGAHLTVTLSGRVVGDLERLGPRRMRFAYSPDAVASTPGGLGLLSQSLPMRDGPFSPSETKPFFEGLLPEGETRRQIAGQLGLRDTAGEFELLAELGRDCAGAVVVAPSGEHQGADDVAPIRWFSETELGERIDVLPRRALGIDIERGTRLCLAGVQPKLVLIRDASGHWGTPTAQSPSTHILKPPLRNRAGDAVHEDLVANELFCLWTLAGAGIPVACAEHLRVDSREVLVVERFDRASDSHGTVRRLHQEDSCQALGRLSEQKYSDETGGVRLPDVFALIGRFAAVPAIERLRLFDQIVANVTLGNADAHGKNIAILYSGPGRGAFSPMYDVVCTAAYADLTTLLAIDVGDARDLFEVGPDSIAMLAKSVGMNTSAATRRAATLSRTVAISAQAARDAANTAGWGRPILDEIVAIAERQAENLSRGRQLTS
jgi:serine/threonine-protein kinase HipA